MSAKKTRKNNASETSSSSESSDSEFAQHTITPVTIPELQPIRVPLSSARSGSALATESELGVPEVYNSDLPPGFFDNEANEDALAQFGAEIAELGDIESEAIFEALVEEANDPNPPETDDWEQLRKEELESIVRSGLERRSKRIREEPTSDSSADNDWRAKAI